MSEAWGDSLERYRSYLRILIELETSPKLRIKLDLSGIIQQTLLDAHNAKGAVDSQDSDLLPWLRRILANNLADEIRKIQSDRRGGGRDVSLEQSLDQSSLKLELLFARDQTTASHRLMLHEQVLRLTSAMANLPAAQREALILQHWQGMKLVEIAQQMGRSRVAVAGLIKRAVQTLRDQLFDPDSQIDAPRKSRC